MVAVTTMVGPTFTGVALRSVGVVGTAVSTNHLAARLRRLIARHIDRITTYQYVRARGGTRRLTATSLQTYGPPAESPSTLTFEPSRYTS